MSAKVVRFLVVPAMIALVLVGNPVGLPQGAAAGNSRPMSAKQILIRAFRVSADQKTFRARWSTSGTFRAVCHSTRCGGWAAVRNFQSIKGVGMYRVGTKRYVEGLGKGRPRFSMMVISRYSTRLPNGAAVRRLDFSFHLVAVGAQAASNVKRVSQGSWHWSCGSDAQSALSILGVGFESNLDYGQAETPSEWTSEFGGIQAPVLPQVAASPVRRLREAANVRRGFFSWRFSRVAGSIQPLINVMFVG